MPDTWGRTLLKRRAAELARLQGKAAPDLYDVDFLLGVSDKSSMGALRFKLGVEGPFLDSDEEASIPPWTSLRELQYSAEVFENNDSDEVIRKSLVRVYGYAYRQPLF